MLGEKVQFYEKQVETNTVYQGLVVDVRFDKAELSDGSVAPCEVVVHSGGVGIVAVTAEKEVIMVRQYRYPMEEELLEIPAGKREAGEDPLACAIRELSEETGCKAGRIVDLGAIYPSPGFCRETLYLYLALDLDFGAMHLDEGELLSVERHGIDSLIDLIMKNELPDAKSIIGIMKAKAWLETT
jgi:ADP-ribose pyrophosphatase